MAKPKNKDRDSKGQFAPGWQGGPGRPRRETEREYLDTLIATVTAANWRKVVSQALQDAIGGDPKAREWLGRYLLPAAGSEGDETPAITLDEGYFPIEETSPKLNQ